MQVHSIAYWTMLNYTCYSECRLALQAVRQVAKQGGRQVDRQVDIRW